MFTVDARYLEPWKDQPKSSRLRKFKLAGVRDNACQQCKSLRWQKVQVLLPNKHKTSSNDVETTFCANRVRVNTYQGIRQINLDIHIFWNRSKNLLKCVHHFLSKKLKMLDCFLAATSSFNRFKHSSLKQFKGINSWFDQEYLESLAGCRTMFLFADFCKIGELEHNAYWFHV